jgi:type II secretory pathway pseudopilin PulG
MNGEPDKDEAGFGLVEVIAALAIFTLSLSVLLGLISDGLWRTARAATQAEALSLARSLLAQVGTAVPLREGQTAGVLADGLRWRLQLEPFADAADREQPPVAAYKVSVEVTWNDVGQRQSLALATLRLAPAELAR